MEKIKIKDQEYGIKSMSHVYLNVIRIEFFDEFPSVTEWGGDISIYTAGGVLADTLTGWGTVYRDEGQVVYLSNDGSTYDPPDEPGELPEMPYVPTLEELQANKRREVSAACERAIYNGVSVTLAGGSVEHFALTEHDQINLFGKQAQLAAGVEQLEYHADGQPCRYYRAADMQAIITAAMWHVSYHTTYCNAINMWIAGCETAEEVTAIFYGADVPEEYQSEVLQAYLTQIAAMAGGDSDENGA
ncbi:acyl carrier protein [Lachnoclostridium sp. An14]|uniref:DUF4376 domain-containing protein n=1 Tax=Lachnoclostridium sp. An14 TaxID=1965562 RepID=UPI000B39F006|nr:acyl carrier protein [Lachnoclostridium sp. An14]OUQ13039.1 acyl carrier protein [Lachnoclostridium sp. An14]